MRRTEKSRVMPSPVTAYQSVLLCVANVAKNVLDIFFGNDATCNVISCFNYSWTVKKYFKSVIASIKSHFCKILQEGFSKTKYLDVRPFASVLV